MAGDLEDFLRRAAQRRQAKAAQNRVRRIVVRKASPAALDLVPSLGPSIPTVRPNASSRPVTPMKC